MKKKDIKKLGGAVKGIGAIEEVAPTAASPESSTAAPEATAISNAKAEQISLSPYASNPITINVGPAPVTYHVLWHLLKSTKWSTVPAGGEISLPKMSADTGHVLVHYLYTGAYQTLESTNSVIAQQPQLALKQALLAYRASVTYSLDGLELLARQQIEEHSASMDLKTILDITRSELSKNTEPSDWLQAYLKDKAQKAFEKDHTVFADDAFCASLCKQSKLNNYVMRHVVKLLSEKLTEALAAKASVAYELDQFLRPQPVPDEMPDMIPDEMPDMIPDEIPDKIIDGIVADNALAQYAYIDGDQPPAPDFSEEPAAVEEPELCWEFSAPAPEPETYDELSIPAPEAEPCYDSIGFVDSGPQEEEQPVPEPLKSIWVDYVPPPAPKNETSTGKKKRLTKEKKDKEKWDKEQQERIDREEEEAACDEPVPTTDVCWEESASPSESNSSWSSLHIVR